MRRRLPGRPPLHCPVRGFGRRPRCSQLDLLDDYDRVVQNDADRQHQPEQRKLLGRKAEPRHDGECRPWPRARPSTESASHASFARRPTRQSPPGRWRLESVLKTSRIDSFDERGRVVDDPVFKPFAESPFFNSSIWHGRRWPFEGVPPGKLKDRQRRPKARRRACRIFRILRTELELDDLAMRTVRRSRHLGDVPCLFLLFTMISPNCSFIDQPAERVDGKLELLGLEGTG